MSNGTGNVDILVKARGEASGLEPLELSLNDLHRALAQAQKDFKAAAPDSEQYRAAAATIGQLSGRISELLRPVREYAQQQATAAEQTQRLNALMTSGVNPWTTASAAYRVAQAALQSEAAAARQAAEEHEKLQRIKRMQTADARGEAVAAAYRQQAEDLRDAEARTARLAEAARNLNEEGKKTKEVQDKSSESTRNAGLSMLLFGQALEDAQYGLRAVMNNIPGLILAMGGGPGLAGIISVVLVGFVQLQNLLKDTDFSGTWIGAVKDKLTQMLTGMTEYEAQLRAIAASPVSWSKTGTEALTAYHEATERVLTREIALLKERNELLKHANEMRLEELAHEERLFQIKNPSLDQSAKGTEAWARREESRLKSGFDEREVGRVKELDNARKADEEAARIAQIKTREATAAKGRVASTEKMEALQIRASDLAAQNEAEKVKIERIVAAKSLSPGLRQAAELAAENSGPKLRTPEERAAADRELQLIKKQMASLPALVPGQTAQQAREEAAEKQREAEDATARAAAAARARQKASQTYTQGRTEDEAGLDQGLKDVNSSVFERISEDQEKERKGKTGENKIPAFENQPAPQSRNQAAVQSPEMDQAAQWLSERAQGTGNAEAKAMLEQIKVQLMDGQGNTRAELALVQELMRQVSGGTTEAMGALTQTGRDMAELARGVVSTVSNVSQTLAAALDRIRALEQEAASERNRSRN